jgi:hypothetical protein
MWGNRTEARFDGTGGLAQVGFRGSLPLLSLFNWKKINMMEVHVHKGNIQILISAPQRFVHI